MGGTWIFDVQAWREAVAAPTPVPGECATCGKFRCQPWQKHAKTTGKAYNIKFTLYSSLDIYSTWSERFLTSNWTNWKSTLYKTQYHFALQLKRTGSLGQRGFRSLGLKFFGHVHWDRDKTHGTGCCCWCFGFSKVLKPKRLRLVTYCFGFGMYIPHADHPFRRGFPRDRLNLSIRWLITLSHLIERQKTRKVRTEFSRTSLSLFRYNVEKATRTGKITPYRRHGDKIMERLVIWSVKCTDLLIWFMTDLWCDRQSVPSPTSKPM